mmetsp:Transcript_7637/g.15941  ORF Transcript_7637/g.15941 Transcript_7637/m.15941 type:complete len:213 (+) Transcript_7637:1374-2012(+)
MRSRPRGSRTSQRQPRSTTSAGTFPPPSRPMASRGRGSAFSARPAVSRAVPQLRTPVSLRPSRCGWSTLPRRSKRRRPPSSESSGRCRTCTAVQRLRRLPRPPRWLSWRKRSTTSSRRISSSVERRTSPMRRLHRPRAWHLPSPQSENRAQTLQGSFPSRWRRQQPSEGRCVSSATLPRRGQWPWWPRHRPRCAQPWRPRKAHALRTKAAPI